MKTMSSVTFDLLTQPNKNVKTKKKNMIYTNFRIQSSIQHCFRQPKVCLASMQLIQPPLLTKDKQPSFDQRLNETK